MGFVNLPLGVRVALEFNLNDKVVVNVYHVTTTDPIITVKLLSIANIFVDWWDSDFKALFSEDLELFQVTALDISVPNGEKQTVVVSPAEAGTVLNGSMPNNVAGVVSYKTAKTGRSFMGRTYLAGINEDGVEGNTISGTRVTAILADYATLVTILNAGDILHVVASFVTEGEDRANGVATEIDSYAMNQRVDTQRRRLP